MAVCSRYLWGTVQPPSSKVRRDRGEEQRQPTQIKMGGHGHFGVAHHDDIASMNGHSIKNEQTTNADVPSRRRGTQIASMPVLSACLVLILSQIIVAPVSAFIPNPTANSIHRIRHTVASLDVPKLADVENKHGHDAAAFSLFLARRSSQANRESMGMNWLPLELQRLAVAKDDTLQINLPDEDDDFLFSFQNLDSESQDTIDDLESRALALLAGIIQDELDGKSTGAETADEFTSPAYQLVKGRFIDLACTQQGIDKLERLFLAESAQTEPDYIILAAAAALQSLLVTGTQTGLKGVPDQRLKSLSHLRRYATVSAAKPSPYQWTQADVRRLKYHAERTAGIQILAALGRKRMPQGARDLLVDMGAWTPDENMPLLRSGFAIQFTPHEVAFAEAELRERQDPEHDIDEALGIRLDLRHHKVFTIDGADAAEIDDGLSIERIPSENGSDEERYRLWIHIADPERWAPRDSRLFEMAKARATSVYLPETSLPMFPSCASDGCMSLSPNKDVETCTLSLGVELNPDGSINESSLVVAPSHIHISYKLTYDDVDEMFDEGIAYREEWELGALLDAAMLRRSYRIQNDSSEGFIPNQIPSFEITVDDKQEIDFKIRISHNGGRNQTSTLESSILYDNPNVVPVSSASTMVTEMMILSGEAMGKWGQREQAALRKAAKESGDDTTTLSSSSSTITTTTSIPNKIRLAYRAQPPRDLRSRPQEKNVMLDLLEHNIGDGLCHAFYARRFFAPATVSEEVRPHAGLGLDCYVQWSSPIRRLADLQVHTVVKRFLRRQKVNQLMSQGAEIPSILTPGLLGCAVPIKTDEGTYEWDNEEYVGYGDNAIFADFFDDGDGMEELDSDINYQDGQGLARAARNVARESQIYWLYEYIRRQVTEDPDKVYKALVLGCTNPTKRQYAIYFYELGFEYRFVNADGNLSGGDVLKLKVSTVSPQNGQLLLTRVV